MNVRRPVATLIAVCLTLSTHGVAAPTTAPAPKPTGTPAVVRVACVGDSLTEGFPLKHPDHDAYPAVLGRLLGKKYDVKNFGAGGTTVLRSGDRPFVTDSRHFFERAKDFKPDVVVLMMGTNDSKANNFAREADFAADLGRLVDDFADLPTHPKVVLCLPPPAFSAAYDINNANLGQLVPLIRQVAEDKKLPLIDVRSVMAERGKDFPDGIHPNEAAAATIAEAVRNGLMAAPTPPPPTTRPAAAR